MSDTADTVALPDLAQAAEVRDHAAHRQSLRDIPARWADPPAHMIAQVPRGGTKLDYIGHAEVTLALISIDPEWSWAPGWDSTAGPIDPFAQGPGVLLGTLTVLGKTMPCVGTIESKKIGTENAMKELVSDLIRNGAMRFGIGTGLWSKADRAGHDADVHQAARPAPAPPPGTVGVGHAKNLVLSALGGDANHAAECWTEADFTVTDGLVSADALWAFLDVIAPPGWSSDEAPAGWRTPVDPA